MKLSGGEKFEAALKEIAEQVSKPGLLRVGFLENATYPETGQKVAEVAFYNEFGRTVKTKGEKLADGTTSEGTYYQLPRPFFRNMIAKYSPQWPEAVAKDLKRTKYDVKRTLERTGLAIEGQLRQSIQDTNSPPLAQSTIDRKGFSKPLIDTGVMWNHVASQVKT